MTTLDSINSLLTSDLKHFSSARFALLEEGGISLGEDLRNQLALLRPIFRACCSGRSTLVLDDIAGLHSLLALEEGASRVTAVCSSSAQAIAVGGVLAHYGYSADVIQCPCHEVWGSLVFVHPQVFDHHEAVICIDAFQKLFREFSGNFDAVASFLDVLATEAALVSWQPHNSRRWFHPPASHASLDGLSAALVRRFEHLTLHANQVILAQKAGGILLDGNFPPDQADSTWIQTINAGSQSSHETDWLHVFSASESGIFQTSGWVKYREDFLKRMLPPLLIGKSILAMDEQSGYYASLMIELGARCVDIALRDGSDMAFVETVCQLPRDEIAILQQPPFQIVEDRVLIEQKSLNSYDYVFVYGTVYPMFEACGRDFKKMTDIFYCISRKGILCDWLEAEWDGRPETFRLEGLIAALQSRFRSVTLLSEWLLHACDPIG